MAEDEEDYPLHESVFNGDIDKVIKLLEISDVSKKDKHGKYHLLPSFLYII